jgi:hypothetical protein
MEPGGHLHAERRVELVEQPAIAEAQLWREARIPDAGVVTEIGVERAKERRELIVLIPDGIPGRNDGHQHPSQHDCQRAIKDRPRDTHPTRRGYARAYGASFER